MKLINALVVKLVDTGLKILAACGVPVRVWPRAPVKYFSNERRTKQSFRSSQKKFYKPSGKNIFRFNKN